jgi:uncharacterized membrane protein (UPF0127 family)
VELVRVVADERPEELRELVVLGTWAKRLRGLLGTDERARPVLLTRCRSIHTCGMRYALDVAFVGERGEVLSVLRGLAPRRHASCTRAVCVAERPAGEGEWFEEGQHLWIVSVSLGVTGT